MAHAILDVDCILLRDALHLPDTARILYAIQPINGYTVRLVVESDDFPEVKQGDNLPLLSPEFQTEWQSIAVSTKLVSWGLR